MNVRTRFVLLTGAWIALIAALTVAVAVGYRDRLPNPLAAHWGPTGEPDSPLSLGVLVAIVTGMWTVIAAICLAVSLTGRLVWRRSTRAWTGAGMAWGGVFTFGMLALTVWANLDAPGWRDARQLSWHLLVLIAGALFAGWLGWLAARTGPDERTDRTEPPARSLTLRPGERAVWVSSASNSLLVGLGTALLAMAAATAGAMVFGLPRTTWIAVGVLAVTGVLGLAISSVRVQVSDRGLEVAYGVWRWPRRHAPLERIDSASVDERRPADVGGWGHRGLPGGATVMIRAGECLVLRYTSGAELGISVDDAEQGAALVNALRAKHPAG